MTQQGPWLDRTTKRPLPVEDILADYRAGLGSAKLSFKYDAGLVTIRDLLRAHGVELQRGRRKQLAANVPPPDPAPVVRASTDEPPPDNAVRINVREALRLLRDGQSFDEVAEHFDADTDSFSEVMLGPWEREQARLQRFYDRQLREAGKREEGRYQREQAALEREERRQRVKQEVARQRRENETRARKERERRGAAARREQEKRDERARQEELERQRACEAEERRQEELRSQVYELYGEGWTLQEIAERVNVSPTPIRRFLEEWGVDRPRLFHVTDTAVEDCWHDVEFLDYARDLQATARQVRGWTPQDSPLRRASEELAELLAMSWQAGVPAQFMAKQLGVTAAAVRMRINRHGYAEMMPSQLKQGGYYGVGKLSSAAHA